MKHRLILALAATGALLAPSYFLSKYKPLSPNQVAIGVRHGQREVIPAGNSYFWSPSYEGAIHVYDNGLHQTVLNLIVHHDQLLALQVEWRLTPQAFIKLDEEFLRIDQNNTSHELDEPDVRFLSKEALEKHLAPSLKNALEKACQATPLPTTDEALAALLQKTLRDSGILVEKLNIERYKIKL